MEAQSPAQGILINNDFGDSKFYTVVCSCGNPDDELRLEVEADECNVTVHIWNTVKTNWWDKSANRFKLIWKLLTKGYLEYESWTLLNRQQALNFAETLKSAINDVEQFRNERKSNVTGT